MPDLPLSIAIVLVAGLASLLGGALVAGRRTWATLIGVVFIAALAVSLSGSAEPFEVAITGIALATGTILAFSLAGLPTHRADVLSNHARAGLVPGLLAISVAGVMVIAGGRDTAARLVGLEIAIAPIGVMLLRTSGDHGSRAAALRFAATELVGFAVLAVGLMCASEFSIGAEPTRGGVLAVILVMCGLGIRARVAPFHIGHDEVHAGIGTWASGVVSVLPRLAVAVFLLRIAPRLAELSAETLRMVGVVLLIAGVLSGGVAALHRVNLRRIVSAATMAHFALVFGGVAVLGYEFDHPAQSLFGADTLPDGRGTILWHLLVHTVLVTGLSAALLYASRPERPLDFVDDLAGLGRTEPAAAASLSVVLLALAGLPPFVGFWLRVNVVGALASVVATAPSGDGPFEHRIPTGGLGLHALAAIVAVLGGVLLAAAFARWLSTMLFDEPRTSVRPSGGEPALAFAVLIALAALGTGLFPAMPYAWVRSL